MGGLNKKLIRQLSNCNDLRNYGSGRSKLVLVTHQAALKDKKGRGSSPPKTNFMRKSVLMMDQLPIWSSSGSSGSGSIHFKAQLALKIGTKTQNSISAKNDEDDTGDDDGSNDSNNDNTLKM